MAHEIVAHESTPTNRECDESLLWLCLVPA